MNAFVIINRTQLIFFFTKSRRYGTVIEYILPSMLSAIGLFCGNAAINVFFSTTAPIVYSCLVAQPSTGKSKALCLVNGGITAVERHLGYTHMQSKQVNPPSTGALVRLLKELTHVIGKSNRKFR